MTEEKRDLPGEEQSASNAFENREETVKENESLPATAAEEQHPAPEEAATPESSSPVQGKQSVALWKQWTGRISSNNRKLLAVGAACLAVGLLLGSFSDHDGKGDHRGGNSDGKGFEIGHQREFNGHGGRGGRGR